MIAPSEVERLRLECKALEDLLPYLKEERRERVRKLISEVQQQLIAAEERSGAAIEVIRLRRVKPVLAEGT